MIKRVALTLLVLALVAGFVATNNALHKYTKEVTVTHVTGDEITVTDGHGIKWSFHGEGYRPGQVIVVRFWDNETPSVYDDEIIEVRESR